MIEVAGDAVNSDLIFPTSDAFVGHRKGIILAGGSGTRPIA
jgi:hypothetical protein